MLAYNPPATPAKLLFDGTSCDIYSMSDGKGLSGDTLIMHLLCRPLYLQQKATIQRTCSQQRVKGNLKSKPEGVKRGLLQQMLSQAARTHCYHWVLAVPSVVHDTLLHSVPIPQNK